MSKYRKFLVALGGFAAIVADSLADGVVVANELESAALALVSAVFVFLVPNEES